MGPVGSAGLGLVRSAERLLSAGATNLTRATAQTRASGAAEPSLGEQPPGVVDAVTQLKEGAFLYRAGGALIRVESRVESYLLDILA
jgi:hypothetical protein